MASDYLVLGVLGSFFEGVDSGEGLAAAVEDLRMWSQKTWQDQCGEDDLSRRLCLALSEVVDRVVEQTGEPRERVEAVCCYDDPQWTLGVIEEAERREAVEPLDHLVDVLMGVFRARPRAASSVA